MQVDNSFYIFKSLGEKNQKLLLTGDTWKLFEAQISVPITNEVLLALYSCPFTDLLTMAAFMFQRLSCGGVVETVWLAKPKIFTKFKPLQKRFAYLWPRTRKAPINIC